MGCFLLHNDKIFIIPFDGIEEAILSVHDAIVEKTDDFWVIKKVIDGEKLSIEKHYFIKEGKRLEKYCNFCKYRLRAINHGCNTCSFASVKNVSFGEMKTLELISSLKEKGCYEVDRSVFQDEVKLRKIQFNKKKNEH